ncbi:MAG: hypothetical protein RMK91_04700 [Pseudanabaenaceae cyanobacterium SKYGB_i_bin29]|nr:hypothetical protein [Pseudanabaenaceae cyanobacterium SKYG29]MDW8421144.1 hypothetical protein [Pseudanabaenaceae cyanobacterium SKYGB_i_bin29]
MMGRIFVIACLFLCLVEQTVLAATPAEIARLEAIKDQMAKVRFCTNDSCFFRRLTLRIDSPTQATIAAEIDRPAGVNVNDTADYHFTLINGKWHLTSGEEYTDVADYAYKGSNYEIYSVHSSRILSGDLNTLSPTSALKSGYLAIYNKVLHKGQERL